jgi:hypothetical protein
LAIPKCLSLLVCLSSAETVGSTAEGGEGVGVLLGNHEDLGTKEGDADGGQAEGSRGYGEGEEL